MTDIVGKLWGFCHTLRHDGIDYGDYIEQLTYLLFLKMIEEKGAEIPPEYSWMVLREKSSTDLTKKYPRFWLKPSVVNWYQPRMNWPGAKASPSNQPPLSWSK